MLNLIRLGDFQDYFEYDDFLDPSEFPLQTNETCPSEFLEYDDKCYYTNETICRYLKPLPFEEIEDIARDINGSKLDIKKTDGYEYYQWQEIGGNYGKLFNHSLHGLGEYVAVNYTGINETFYAIEKDDSSYDKICAYYQNETNQSFSYCHLFDKICAKNNKSRDATNCHCRNRTSSYFCELYCEVENKTYSEEICSSCQEVLEKYKRPSIRLNFDYIKSRIFITITSYLKLLPVTTQGLVYCFTDASYSPQDITFRYEFGELYNDTGYKTAHYYIWPVNNYIGHYWCEGFEFNDVNLDKVYSDTILAQNNSLMRESFTMNVTVINATNQSSPLTIHEEIENYLEKVVFNKSIFIEEVRFFYLYKRENNSNSIKMAYRLYMYENRTDIAGALEEVKNLIEALPSDENLQSYKIEDTNQTYQINKTSTSLSPSYCLPDVTEMGDFNLTWDKTLLGITTTPRELCLQSNGEPVTRTCLGEYLYGTFWSAVEGTCEGNSGEIYGSDKTTDLHDLTYSNSSSEEKINQLKKLISDNYNEYITIDIHFISQILENIAFSSDTYDLKGLIEIASSFMDLNITTIKRAQYTLNSTDKLLYSLDNALNANNYNISDANFDNIFFQIKTKNIYLQVSNILKNMITGVAFYGDKNDVLDIVRLTETTTLENLNLENLQLAAFMTGTQLLQFRKLGLNDSKLITILFRHDSLFNEWTNPTTAGYLIGFYVSGFDDPFLYDYIKILTKPKRRFRATNNCSYWNYGRNKLWYNIQGKWKREAQAQTYGDLYFCRYSHMTHFGILINQEESIVLSIITLIGCVLSMMGAVAVIVTAIIYRSWRHNAGTKILINFVATILLQNILLSVASGVDSFKHENTCIFVGALLHYCVGSQFSWMLIIAYLQYQRYVTVYFAVNTVFIVYASIAAWGLPLIPVITILIIDKRSYAQEKYCYLKDKPLYFGVFMPISIVLTFNIYIFAVILKNICDNKNRILHAKDNISMLHLRLIIVLFFLMGLYWIFGISAGLLRSIALDYFFCISASVEGFIIFIYYLVFNKMTRSFWIRQLRLSKMITTMQMWSQHKKKVGDITLKNKPGMNQNKLA